MADCFTLIAFLMSYDRLILVFFVLWIFIAVSWASLQCVIVVYHDRIKEAIFQILFIYFRNGRHLSEYRMIWQALISTLQKSLS